VSVREAILGQGRPAHRTPGAAGLKGRIGATTVILAAQFWGLTATLTAWQSGNAAALRGSIAFQAVCTAAAVAIGRSKPKPNPT
jgi:hypothetical protein